MPAIVIVFTPKSIIPAVKVNAVAELAFIVKAEPITQVMPPPVLFITKVPKLKFVTNVKGAVPILPTPRKVRLEVVLPLKLPVPLITLAIPVLPTVKVVLAVMSILSVVPPKLITFPTAGPEMVTLLIIRTVVPTPVVTK